MTTMRSGLVALADGVRAYFEANNVPASVPPVGWKYRSFQTNQGPGGGARVCFIPGKIDPSSLAPKVIDAGEIIQPEKYAPGPRLGGQLAGSGNPRPLRTWKKIVSVSIWGVDSTDTGNDELQFAATEALLEWTVRGIHNAVDPVTGINVGLADIEFTEAVWTLPPVERAFGRELVLYLVQHGPLFDVPSGIATPQPGVKRGHIT